MVQQDENIHQIVADAVKETLKTLGIDTDNIRAAQADQLFLRGLREGVENSKKNINRTFWGVVLPALLIVIYQAIFGNIGK